MVNKFAKLLSIFLLFWLGGAAAQSVQVGTGDVLKILVYGHPDLESVERIAEDGTISFPLVGDISVVGMTEREVEKAIAGKLESSRVIRNPDVSVSVEEYSSLRVSILGYVTKPGVYELTKKSTLLDAVAEAGGLTDEAGGMAVITKSGQGAENKVQIDLDALLKAGDISKDVVLADGDRVYISRTPRFFIYGQVNRPNSYRLEPGMNVMQAIAIAGGLTRFGTERGLVINRGESKGMPAGISTPVQDGDVIFVKESLF